MNAQSPPSIVALNLRRIDKPGSAVLGTVSLWFPDWRLRIHEVLWGKNAAGREWVLLPSRSWTAPDGSIHRAKLIEFGDDKTERAFRTSALDAIHSLAGEPSVAADG